MSSCRIKSAGSNGQASGGQAVGGFGNSSEYMNYTIAGVPAGGSYTLHLWYTSGETPQFGIVVNGNLQTISGSGNGSWSGPFIEKTVAINLQAGTNSLRIQGAGGSFVLDRLCVDGGGGGNGCTPPSLNLSTPTCSSNSFYTVSFTTQAGANVSSSAGSVQGNQVVNIPAGTNVTVTAILNGCSTQQNANSPSCNSGGNPPGGNTNTLTKVRFYFRSDNCAPCRNRCAQSQIQGSTDNQNWTTLAIIPSVADGWNEVSVTNPTAWRYVRYQSSGGCYGELMELEFYNGGTKLSGTPFGSAGLDATMSYTSAFDGNLATLWHGAQPGTQNFAGLDLGTSSGGTGSLVSGNCYVIKSQQTSSGYTTLQAIGNQVLLRSANGQADQIWKAESVGSQYRFTSQAGNRDQALYVDGLSNGQPLRLGGYIANERYQWSLATSSQGGYRVYGGGNQNTWDQQGAGSGDVLQLYGSNINSSDYHWDQPYRRFSFSSVGCPGPGPACTPPSLSLGTPACSGNATYSVGFSVQAGANVSSSAGSVQGNQVVNIPAGTNVTVTASLNGCSAQQTASSPTCNSGGNPSGCGTGSGLIGLYFNNDDLSNSPILIRKDQQINYIWDNSSPSPGTVKSDGFSVFWVGYIEAPVTGTYTFKTYNDDGTHLWVNGQMLINDWNGHAPTWQQGSITLSAGMKYEIRMDFFDAWGGAQAQLFWEYPGQGTQLVPSCRLYPIGNSSTFEPSISGVVTSSTGDNGLEYRIDDLTIRTDFTGRVFQSTVNLWPFPKKNPTRCPNLNPKLPRTPKKKDAGEADEPCDNDGGGSGSPPHIPPVFPPSEPLPPSDPRTPVGSNNPQNTPTPSVSGSRVPTTALLEVIDCDKISGWAFANAGGYAYLDIFVYDIYGRPWKAATIKSNNASRPDVRGAYGNNPNIPIDCGFVWAIPDGFKTGHRVTVKVLPVNDNVAIRNSPLTSPNNCSKPGGNPPVTLPLYMPPAGSLPFFLDDRPISEYSDFEIALTSALILQQLGIEDVNQLEGPPYTPILTGLLLFQSVSRETYVLRQMHPE